MIGTLRTREIFDSNPKKSPAVGILCWGDSITVGAGSTGGNTGYTTRLASMTGRTVVNKGISGETLQENGYARYYNDLIETANFNNAIIIYFGTNDVMRCDAEYAPSAGNFEAKLDLIVKSLIVKSRYSKKRIMLSTTGYIAESFLLDPLRSASFQCGTLARQTEVNNIIKKVASQNRVLLCDLFKEMTEFGGDPDDLLDDGLHPNDTGHQLIAQKFFGILANNL